MVAEGSDGKGRDAGVHGAWRLLARLICLHMTTDGTLVFHRAVRQQKDVRDACKRQCLTSSCIQLADVGCLEM